MWNCVSNKDSHSTDYSERAGTFSGFVIRFPVANIGYVILLVMSDMYTGLHFFAHKLFVFVLISRFRQNNVGQSYLYGFGFFFERLIIIFQ